MNAKPCDRYLHWYEDNCKRKRQDYAYVKGEYQSTLRKMMHYLRRENTVNLNQELSSCETLKYMYVHMSKHD